MTSQNVVVLGTGAWGTTFSQVLADAGLSVTMWGRNQAVVEFINEGENPTYLPGIELSEQIRATTDIGEAMATDPVMVVVAVPSYAVAETVSQANLASIDAHIVSLVKGIDLETYHTMVHVIAESAGISEDRIAALSGPNLSREIAQRQPAAAAIASSSFDTAKKVAQLCHTHYFRCYVSTDVIGCEIAGVAKNVIAMAIGAAEGMGLGANTRATLISRGLAEITRLGIAMGAKPGTFSGLAGVGDLIATCSSKLSRNYSLGFHLGQGRTLKDSLSRLPGVAEGARSAKPILQLANSLDVDMPITRGVVAVLHEGATAEQMGEMLLSRPQKTDGWEIELLD
ncbi:NAD(P)-dependent glycerol-3-phosphate dehydrogenase [Actinomycetaceae bacterium WB03_NA08]|uniref:Glycerol-3-phosphate dehydrogenase [NAD(P)+] n=1 Tax=Scrofimicrobium canadense TaxID=2652290 RepID=A0A6N7W351_9ACTO|nr:NAD(P)H-dependent glycerol-3-phosphate dehydrogenase [Scrofimicrobium canadense]MSS83715.1 NAD(P)-dependent glycerol-3-phosphate dehydrogenase [Scrofimicrobium canadense]